MDLQKEFEFKTKKGTREMFGEQVEYTYYENQLGYTINWLEGQWLECCYLDEPFRSSADCDVAECEKWCWEHYQEDRSLRQN